MNEESTTIVKKQLAAHGLVNVGKIHYNLSSAALYDEVVRRGEGRIVHGGPILVDTAPYTGRSPNDRFIVKDSKTADNVAWGEINRPFETEQFERIRTRFMAYFQCREVYVQDLLVGADPSHQRRIRMVTENAWHALFGRNMFISPDIVTDYPQPPDCTIFNASGFRADPKIDGTNSEACVLLNLKKGEVLIASTAYGGENKKAIFSAMNYYMPMEDVMPMHCSANVGEKGDVAVFFGLSGTGKTTLSTDPSRRMIGDDEHGWSDQGVFNFEGGCYAKVIRLSPKAEPEIWNCTRKFGTVIENVVADPVTRHIDLDDDSITENTRAAYSLEALQNIQPGSMAGHPNHVIMLTADAFGVMPPVARLTTEQAMYHFLSGYTAKLAGTERGIKDPVASFSSCFGEPFMVQDPVMYAEMLGKRLLQHNAKCWLVNTGWTAGPYGTGYRMPIQETRTIINAILSDALNDIETRTSHFFRFKVPVAIEGIPDNRLNPRSTWESPDAYDQKAGVLAQRFRENFKKYADRVTEAVRDFGGPRHT
ncbi:MAG: phosphoenolpyruvate carboxykinase (ATP) [Magnetococcales bacterium]|nr:phosphoenolpyruvate carboxykinase (ATP) [Magnetococcales bacterium]